MTKWKENLSDALLDALIVDFLLRDNSDSVQAEHEETLPDALIDALITACLRVPSIREPLQHSDQEVSNSVLSPADVQALNAGSKDLASDIIDSLFEKTRFDNTEKLAMQIVASYAYRVRHEDDLDEMIKAVARIFRANIDNEHVANVLLPLSSKLSGPGKQCELSLRDRKSRIEMVRSLGRLIVAIFRSQSEIHTNESVSKPLRGN